MKKIIYLLIIFLLFNIKFSCLAAGDRYEYKICYGDSVQVGEIQTWGTGPYSYTWTPATGLSSTSIAQPYAKAAAVDEYYVRIRDSQGNIRVDTIEVEADPQLFLNLGPDRDLCLGDTVQIGAQATGGTPSYEYKWTPSTRLTNDEIYNPKAYPNSTTQYILTAKDDMGCEIRDTIVIRVNPKPSINAGNDATICFGDSVQIGNDATSGTPPYSYSWSPAAGLSSAIISRTYAKPASTTNYIVTVTDSKGCTAKDNVTITLNPLVTLNIGVDRDLCLRDTITIGDSAHGGTPPFSYSWSPANALNNANIPITKAFPVVTTQYILTAIDSKGCIKRDTINITVNPTPVANAGNDTLICHDDRTTIGRVATGGTAPYSYSWNPASGLSSTSIAQPLASPIVTTKYVQTVTDQKGCTSKDTVEIKVNPQLSLQMSSGITLCKDSIGAISGMAAGGSGNYSYSWNPTTGLSNPNSNNTNITLTVPGTYYYILQVRDGAGCTKKDSVKVVILSDVALSVSQSTLNFGKLDACTSSKDTTLDLNNDWTDFITINSALFDNQSFSLVSPAVPFSIAPGNSINFTIRFTAKNSGTATGTLTLKGLPCGVTKIINLTAEKMALLITTNPTSINFGSMISCKLFIIDTIVTIKNNGTDNAILDFGKVNPNKPFSLIAPSGVQTMNPGASLTVSFRYAPAGAGSYSQDIAIPFTAGTCKDTIRISLNGVVIEPQIKSIAKSIDFGTMLGCVTYRDTLISVMNEGAYDIQIVGIGGDQAFSAQTTLPITMKPGETKDIKIRFSPTKEGTFAGNLLIKYEPCGKTEQISITALKQGVVFTIPDTINFGEIIYCAKQTADTTFSITNNSSGTIEGDITGVTISSMYSSDISANTKLPNGQTKQFKVTFAPDVAAPFGIIYGELEIVLNPCDIHKKIILIGKKLNPSLAMDRTGIDFGTVLLNNSRQDSIKLFNPGSTYIYLKQGDVKTNPPFIVISTSPALPVRINPKDTLLIRIQYTAINGKSQDSIYVNISAPCPIQLSAWLKGEGSNIPQGKILANGKDFGSIYVGDQKTDSIEVKNVGDLDGELIGAKSSNSEFSIQPGQFPINLIKNASTQIKIDFNPQSTGIKSSTLDVFADIDSASALVTGTVIDKLLPNATAEVSIGKYRKYTGEKFTADFLLNKSSNLNISKITGFDAVIRFNKTVLALGENTPKGISNGNDRIINITGSLKDTIGKIAEMNFIAALGNDSCTALIIDSVVWHGATVSTKLIQGEVCIIDLCREGGLRLVDPDKQMSINYILIQKDGNLEINFNTTGPEQVKISVFDVLGKLEISTIINQPKYFDNKVILNSTNLSEGSYFIVLTNGFVSCSKAFSFRR
ncbi:MAG: 5'-nucleotidase [Ignavibacteria bacterium]|nr:5'-nucleotidase [Ignavibacteria bacterium]